MISIVFISPIQRMGSRAFSSSVTPAASIMRGQHGVHPFPRRLGQSPIGAGIGFRSKSGCCKDRAGIPSGIAAAYGHICRWGLMGILENRPFAFVNIVAFLVFEVLAGLEIDRMT